jgi:nucleoid DNA-binding protein
LTRYDIADIIRELCDLDKKDILFVIDRFVEQIIASVDRGEKVEIRGFGVFSRENRKARTVFSPIVGKKLDVPARSVVTFRPSKQTDKTIKGA